MSDLGTRIEALEAELLKLKEIIKSGKPTCPICMKPMEQANYQGYYDSFSYWGCDCDSFPDADTWNGAYA